MARQRPALIEPVRQSFNKLSIKLQLFILLSPIVLVSVYIVGKVIFDQYLHLIQPLLYHTNIFVLSAAVTAGLTPLIQWMARQYDIVDRPDAIHKAHKGAVPLLGGVAVFSSFLAVLFLFHPWSLQIQSIVAACALMVMIGTLDDIRPLSSGIRLLGQLAAAAIVISSGLEISFLPDTFVGNMMTVIITFMWIIGITNAMNFMDGADGLASGIALIAAFFFFLITLRLGQTEVSLLAAVLGGGCLGFLYYNFKPAKIYLGDGGSTFLGFLLACIALYGGWSEKGEVVALGIPLLILGVLVFDMSYITISRVKNGSVTNLREWVDFVGRDHFHHRLINLGFKEEYAVMFIYITSFILGLSALVLEKSQMPYHVILLVFQAVLIFVSITMLMLVGRKKVTDGKG